MLLLLPRTFLRNDDEGLLLHLRIGALAPFMSPLLSEVLGRLYTAWVDVPWYGAWLYLLHLGAIDVLIRVVRGRVATLTTFWVLAALVVALALLTATLTFTIAGVLACGAAMLGTLAALRDEADGAPPVAVTWWWAMGGLMAAGYMTRHMSAPAGVIACVPTLIWAGWMVAQRRLRVRRVMLIALVVPVALAAVAERHVPQLDEPVGTRWRAFNAARGELHGAARYAGLEHRAPEVLAQAGWSGEDWVIFWHWTFFDERRYTTERLQALQATGGKPMPLTSEFSRLIELLRHHRQMQALVFTLLLCLIGAAFNPIGLRRPLLLAGGSLGLYLLLKVGMGTVSRFPLHVSQPMLLLLVAGAWCIAGARFDGLTDARVRVGRRILALLLIAGILLPFIKRWPRQIPPREALADTRAFNDEVGKLAAAGAWIMVHAGAAASPIDPLAAAPRPYEYACTGWCIFSAPFYRQIKRRGLDRGAELIASLVDDPKAYIVAKKHHMSVLSRLLAKGDKRWRLIERRRARDAYTDVVLLQVARMRRSR